MQSNGCLRCSPAAESARRYTREVCLAHPARAVAVGAHVEIFAALAFDARHFAGGNFTSVSASRVGVRRSGTSSSSTTPNCERFHTPKSAGPDSRKTANSAAATPWCQSARRHPSSRGSTSSATRPTTPRTRSRSTNRRAAPTNSARATRTAAHPRAHGAGRSAGSPPVLAEWVDQKRALPRKHRVAVAADLPLRVAEIVQRTGSKNSLRSPTRATRKQPRQNHPRRRPRMPSRNVRPAMKPRGFAVRRSSGNMRARRRAVAQVCNLCGQRNSDSAV